MKKLLLLLVAVPCTLFAQHPYDDEILYNRMDNLKQNVSSIKELIYTSDKNGKIANDPDEITIFSFDKNKQIKKVDYSSIKNDTHVTYQYSFEEAFPYWIKQKIIIGPFVGSNSTYNYVKKSNQNGATIFKSYLGKDKPFREFVVDENQNVIAVYEHQRGEKSGRGKLFEYNSQGQIIKSTTLNSGDPKSAVTYKLNEYGDIVEQLESSIGYNEADWKNNWKYEYTYTYDNHNNWITKKAVMMGFKENGKLENNKNEYTYKIYTREIEY